MSRTSWHKVVRDLCLNKARTLLAVLAIAIGIFGIGAVLTGYAILTREIDANFMGTNPPSVVLFAENADRELAEAVEALPDVAQAEVRRVVTGRYREAPGESLRFLLFVIDDFDDLQVATFTNEAGASSPARGEVLVERSALPLIEQRIGDMLPIQTPNGQQEELLVTGIVHDPGQSPGFVDHIGYGYITVETLEILGEAATFNEIKLVVAEDADDPAHVADVANQARGLAEGSGYTVSAVNLLEAGRHPHTDQMNSLLFLLLAFGILSLILGAILIANVISALLTQQVRQIGSMKTVGARSGQISMLYAASVLILGLVALAIGLPLGVWAGRLYASITAAFLNFNIISDSIPAWVYLLQISVGLTVPLLGALIPVRRGSRITVYEALSDYGVSDSQFGVNQFDALIGRIRGLGRPLLLSLRNTFRRRTRLGLTVLVMSVGGATFMTAINVSASWTNTVDVAFAARLYDISTRFAEAYPNRLIEETMREIPEITATESWGMTQAVRKLPDGTDGLIFTLTGVPPATTMIDFPVQKGRWLEEGDTNVMVVNQELLDSLEDDGVTVGDTVTLNIGGTSIEWILVGGILEGGAPRRGQNIAASAYVSAEFLASLTGMEGLTNRILVQATEDDDASLRSVIQKMEAAYETAGLKIVAIQPSTERKQELLDHLVVIQVGLALIAGLIVTVGSLGLASTMSINVLERTRELGVMRAIGATSDAVMQVVVFEGLVISLLSWFLAVALSRPLSVVVGDYSGQVFIASRLNHLFPSWTAIAWLATVLIIGIVAGGIPAWRSSQMPVREALAYA